MLLAVLFIWLGCAAVFFSSKQQKLLARRIRKDVAWAIFTLATIIATYLFSQHHLAVTAGLLTLANVMVIWLIFVFSQGHFRVTSVKYLVSAGSFAVISYWLGG